MRKPGLHKAFPAGICALILVMALISLQGKTAHAQSTEPPPAAGLVLSRAYELMQEEEYQQALEVLQDFQARAKNRKPDPERPDPRGYYHPQLYFLKGNIYYLLDELQKARQAYALAVKQDPGHLPARLNLARVFHEQGQYAKAAKHFEQGYAADGEKEAKYLYHAAVSWFMAEVLEDSLRCFAQLQKAHPGDIKLQWRENLVHALLSANKNKQALAQIRILAEQYQGHKKIQWQEVLLHQYLELQMFKQAEEYALELTSQAPDQEKWWKALAHVALARDNHEQAVVGLTIYSYLTPLSRKERKLLGDLRLQVGIPVQAVPEYETLLKQDPDKRVLRNLVSACQQLAEQDRALEAIQAFEGHHEDPELLMLKADLLYQLQRFAEAYKAYQQSAIKEDQQAGKAWLMAGYSAWEAEELDLARQAFAQAAEFEGQRQNAESALQQIEKMQ